MTWPKKEEAKVHTEPAKEPEAAHKEEPAHAHHKKVEQKGPAVPQEAFKKLAAHMRQDAPPTKEDQTAAKAVLACCETHCKDAAPHEGPLLSRHGMAAELERRAHDGLGYCEWPQLHASLLNAFPPEEKKG